jgi:site-specific DNA recombinase
MSKAGLEIEYALGQYAKTAEGDLMKNVKAVIAQYENRQRVERSRRGKRGRAEAGFVLMPAGRAPFGYDYISEKRKGRLEVNEEQAEVVRMMYRWLIEDGLSTYRIAKKLWEEGILSKGDTSSVVAKKEGPASWSPQTVRRMISNSTYKGVWYYGKTRRFKVNGRTVQRKTPESEWIAVPVPAIVDEETWEEAQSCLERNKSMAKRNSRRKYLLRGMVFCPCGRRRVGRYKNHLKRAYYRCPATEAEHWRQKCDHRYSHRQEILERAVWEKVHKFILDPESLIKEIKLQRAQAEEEVERKNKRLEAIDSAIAEVDRKMGMLLDEVLADRFSQSIIDQKTQQLTDQRTRLEIEATQVQEELKAVTITEDHEKELLAFAARMRETLTDLTFEEKRRVLELVRLRVDVLSRTQVRISGVIDPQGSIVELSSA